jgi:uronate dehydrogenase
VSDYGAHPDARPGANRRVLVTGAAGLIGRTVCPGLNARGWSVRGLDKVSLDGVGGLDDAVVADVQDAEMLARVMDGVAGVVHLAGIATEAAFADILASNIDGTYQVLEAARRAGVRRFVYASSNHAVGYTPRGDGPVGTDVPIRPDTYYGVSKAFGEALGRMYADRYGTEFVALRIGSCIAEPTTHRHLATWLSLPDCVRLVHASLTAPDVDFAVAYGISANTRAWWDLSSARALGYLPVDDAERYAERIVAEHGEPDPADPELLLVGGDFTGPKYDVR